MSPLSPNDSWQYTTASKWIIIWGLDISSSHFLPTWIGEIIHKPHSWWYHVGRVYNIGTIVDELTRPGRQLRVTKLSYILAFDGLMFLLIWHKSSYWHNYVIVTGTSSMMSQLSDILNADIPMVWRLFLKDVTQPDAKTSTKLVIHKGTAPTTRRYIMKCWLEDRWYFYKHSVPEIGILMLI